MRSPRLWAAVAAFGLIGVLAFTTLEGKYRQAVLILVVGLGVRVVIAHLIDQTTPPPPVTKTPESH